MTGTFTRTRGVAFALLLLGAACSRGPYADLERAFPARATSPAATLPVESMVLVSPRHKGAHNYKNMTRIGLHADGLIIAPRSAFMKSVHIPPAAVAGCSKSCFGGSIWDADILVGNPPVEVSFHQSSAVLDWCWERGLPVISKSEETDWMYRGKPLTPDRRAKPELSSHRSYDEALGRACRGY